MKKIAILGSTGSIGINALKVIKDFPEEFQVWALSTNVNIWTLKKQVKIFKPKLIAINNLEKARLYRERFDTKGITILEGLEGILTLATAKEIDIVVIGISGSYAIFPLMEAIKKGKLIALANKEAMVMAGEIIRKLLARYNKAKILPVDSEHSAIFQILEGKDRQEIKRLILTSSGGPFNKFQGKRLAQVKPSQALKHPRWQMGKKISIDSATLMNKALEVIEAHWLFEIPVEKIEVLIHPEAIIHSMVEFVDGSIFAILGITDMQLPLQYALTYPNRLETKLPKVDFTRVRNLGFSKPDFKKFPCLRLGYSAAKRGGVFPCSLNASNEVCVEEFLRGYLGFTHIPRIIKKVMEETQEVKRPNLNQLLKVDAWARERARELINRRC